MIPSMENVSNEATKHLGYKDYDDTVQRKGDQATMDHLNRSSEMEAEDWGGVGGNGPSNTDVGNILHLNIRQIRKRRGISRSGSSTNSIDGISAVSIIINIGSSEYDSSVRSLNALLSCCWWMMITTMMTIFYYRLVID